jgi:glucose-1-phosphate cytidylyltransferase
VKVVILAGGLGTRLAEETEVKPKPMIEVGGHPILWHIMKHYAHYGFKEFFIALGYKGEAIKRYFMDYYTLNGSITIDLATGKLQSDDPECEDWIVHLKNTGLKSNTGGRVRRLQPFLSDATFMVTYGDGVSNINLHKLLAFHKSHGRVATVTAVRPPARFGGLIFDQNGFVTNFTEKPQIGEGWINGGFLVLEPTVFNYLDSDESTLEVDALERLAADSQLAAYQHQDFWQCMDTMRDKLLLESLWQSGNPPWIVRENNS